MIRKANWPSHASVYAFTTTRSAGLSLAPYQHNNLGHHVGDQAESVAHNRQQLMLNHHLPQPPNWLEQTHSTRCITIEQTADREADAAITRQPNQVLAILTADCLPILLSAVNGTEIAAIHAGWRGLANGVVESTLHDMHTHPNQLMAWLGPRICQHCFEVGEEVLEIFLQRYPFAEDAFHPSVQKAGFRYFNLAQLTTQILYHLGIRSIFDSQLCTFENSEHFYSYRRDGQTGRMASIIWFSAE